MKELFIAEHEKAQSEYLEANPGATEDEAYDRTADLADIRMRERLADMADHYRQLKKDGML